MGWYMRRRTHRCGPDGPCRRLLSLRGEERQCHPCAGSRTHHRKAQKRSLTACRRHHCPPCTEAFGLERIRIPRVRLKNFPPKN